MSANFEQAYNILQTLNIDLQGFNNYLTEKLNISMIKKEVKDITKEENKKDEKIKFCSLFANKKAKWGDYEDEDAVSVISDTTSSTCSIADVVSIISETTSSTCSATDTVSMETSSDTSSTPLNFLSVVSSTSMESEGFKTCVSKKIQRKQVILNKSTNPMFEDYGLCENKTVYNRMEFARAISEKWTLGTEYQIHPNAFCSTMMEGNVCKEYCECVHLHRCKFETDGKACTNSKCKFLHSRDMLTKEARSNFQQNLKY